MYLNIKHILSLLLPFLVAVVLYIFSEDIIQNIKYLFPKYNEYTNKILDKKVDVYLNIAKESDEFIKIQKKIALRNKNSQWIKKDFLYQDVSIVQEKKTKKPHKNNILELQMVYPKRNIAIINNKIVHINDKIGGMQLISIEADRILIKNKKGLRWINLF